MKILVELELQAAQEGREYARRLLQERLQSQADTIPVICPASGVLLKDVRYNGITLITCLGEVQLKLPYGYSKPEDRWISPVRDHWQLTSHQRISPELQHRLTYCATQVGSYEKAAAMSTLWGCPLVSDDLVRNHVMKVGPKARDPLLLKDEIVKKSSKNEAPFSLVIMMDGWMVRTRGEKWGDPTSSSSEEGHVCWREVKSAVIYRLEQRAENDSGRGMIIEKKVVATKPGTEPVDFGAAVQAQALESGMARAKEVYVINDGAVWIWNITKDRFANATQVLDFYHASEHLWQLGRYLHGENKEATRNFVEPLLHQLRHGKEQLVINTLKDMACDIPLNSDAELVGRINYILNHEDHLHYEAVSTRGAPIGSGAMESQCGAFQDRFKRTGQFWSCEGFANLLALDVAARNRTFDLLRN